MKNAFYFLLKALFVLKLFKFLSRLLGYVEKNGLIRKDQINFKIYDVTTWLTNNYNIFIAQYLTKQRHQLEFGHLVECNKRNIFLQISCRR